MRLSKIALENFRCFAALELDLHPQMTVLVAENGLGKSSVLDAIRIALWPFVSSFDLARNAFNDPGNGIAIDDIRLAHMSSRDMARQLPCRVIAAGDFGSGSERIWIRYRDKESYNSKTKDAGDTSFMRQWAGAVQTQIRDPEEPTLDLPVFGYYGTGRLWSQKKLTELTRSKDDTQTTNFYIRTFAYMNCLDPASSFKHFKEWFTWVSQVRMESAFKHVFDGTVSDEEQAAIEAPVQVVQQAINQLLRPTGWHSLSYSQRHEKSLVLEHAEFGTMKIDMLSDGVRSVLAMVGDIAYRCVKLNPHLGSAAARETAGVVLIDEIDMHLHPRWQQVVVGQLQQAFPRIQFVVTTHSPQVISSVDSGSIRILHEGKVHHAPPGTEGAESARILKRVFEVDPRPQENQATKDLNEYLQLVYTDQWASTRAIELRALLDARYQGEEPALTEADLHIENREWEKSIESDKNA